MGRMSLLLTGLAGGLLNGLFGAGGGMAIVPLLGRAGLETQRAHATSIAVTLPLSVASSLFYLSLGNVRLGEALPFLPLGLAGAWLGGRLLPHLQSVWLHRMFGVVVIYSALRLLLA